MSHAHIMLLDSFLRYAWYEQEGFGLSRAMFVSQYWPTGQRYIRSE